MDTAQAPRICLRKLVVADVRESCESAQVVADESRACARQPSIQPGCAHFTGAGSEQRILSLAHRVHAKVDQNCGIRMGYRVLYQSHPAGRGSKISTRGKCGRCCSEYGECALNCSTAESIPRFY